jgi:putative addiction module component (TIGR02574 family)
MQIADVKEYVLSRLTPLQVRQLGQELLGIIPSDEENHSFSPDQMAELERRLEEIKSGRIKPLPWNNEVLETLRNGN